MVPLHVSEKCLQAHLLSTISYTRGVSSDLGIEDLIRGNFSEYVDGSGKAVTDICLSCW